MDVREDRSLRLVFLSLRLRVSQLSFPTTQEISAVHQSGVRSRTFFLNQFLAGFPRQISVIYPVLLILGLLRLLCELGVLNTRPANGPIRTFILSRKGEGADRHPVVKSLLDMLKVGDLLVPTASS